MRLCDECVCRGYNGLRGVTGAGASYGGAGRPLSLRGMLRALDAGRHKCKRVRLTGATAVSVASRRQRARADLPADGHGIDVDLDGSGRAPEAGTYSSELASESSSSKSSVERREARL